ncbi:MAG: acyl-CoA dehydrogenase family protein [Mycobacteriaceae bacterium]
MICDSDIFRTSARDVPGLAAVVAAAADAANDVDEKSRFPAEAVAALKEAGLLSCCLPSALGGRSSGVAELAGIARALGAACSSTGMVFAMHHTQALTLAHHASHGPIAELTATIAAEEALLASATTEITTGGDVRSSTCALTVDGPNVVLEKNAPVISYAENADYICATARRSPDSAPSDQALLVCPAASTSLEMTIPWNTLGFRGTCSHGYLLRAVAPALNVVPAPYLSISERTMLPASHLLWSAVWLGMADAAMQKARKTTQRAARKAGGKAIPQSAALLDLTVAHQSFEALVMRELDRYTNYLSSGEPEVTVGFTIAMNNLKLASSTTVVEIVGTALRVIGINGYREDHPDSVGRLLRDSFAPQLMVSNDRIRAGNAQLILAHRGLG